MKTTTLIQHNYLMSMLPETVPTFWEVMTSEDSQKAMERLHLIVDLFNAANQLKEPLKSDGESAYYKVDKDTYVVLGPVYCLVTKPGSNYNILSKK